MAARKDAAKKDGSDKDGAGKDPKHEPGPDDIMPAAALKSTLAVAKRGEPVNCAIALTKDREAIVLVDKQRRHKQLLAEIKKKSAGIGLQLEATSLRSGHASVDTDRDAKLVTLTINKDASSATRMPLLERFKKAGFSKLEFVVDTKLDAESEEDEPAAGTPASQTALLKELTQGLAGLIRQIPAVAAAAAGSKNGLVALAETAKSALARGDAQRAKATMATLAGQLKEASPAAHPAASRAAEAAGAVSPAADTQAVATKAQLAWSACLKIAAREIEKLRAEVTSAYRDHGFGSEVDKFFQTQIDPALKQLQASELAAKLTAASRSASAAERRQLLQEGVRIVEGLESLVASDPVLKKLDNNPFTELVITKTAATTLGTLKKTLQSAAQA